MDPETGLPHRLNTASRCGLTPGCSDPDGNLSSAKAMKNGNKATCTTVCKGSRKPKPKNRKKLLNPAVPEMSSVCRAAMKYQRIPYTAS